MDPFNWTCPHCDRDTTISGERYIYSGSDCEIPNADGNQRLSWEFIVCPNKECRRLTLLVKVQEYSLVANPNPPFGHKRTYGRARLHQRLLPQSTARVFPTYIPAPIRQDYEEACAIVDLSPKASATLARRCLQGMIRDYWGVSKPRLIDEVRELKDNVDAEVWSAIDALRKVGNIGAHMEADINVIVDVDDGEAAKLIWLIELLMKEWYVARHERQQRVQEVIAVAEGKQTAKASGKAPAAQS
jgi:hypothetical protein